MGGGDCRYHWPRFAGARERKTFSWYSSRTKKGGEALGEKEKRKGLCPLSRNGEMGGECSRKNGPKQATDPEMHKISTTTEGGKKKQSQFGTV